MRKLILNSSTRRQRNGDGPNAVVVWVTHGRTIAAPAIKGAIELRGGEGADVGVHVDLESHVGGLSLREVACRYQNQEE